MATNTSGNIGYRTNAYVKGRMLQRGQYLLVTERFGQSAPIPKHASKTRTFRRVNALLRATAPLAEAVVPAGQQLSVTDVTCTMEQYGAWVPLSDVVLDTNEDPILNEAADACGEQAAETIEVVRIAVLTGGTNVFYVGTATTRATVNGSLAGSNGRDVFRKVYRSFKTNKAREISKIIKATAMVATQPVAPAYFAMGHTDLLADLAGATGFVQIENYSD